MTVAQHVDIDYCSFSQIVSKIQNAEQSESGIKQQCGLKYVSPYLSTTVAFNVVEIKCVKFYNLVTSARQEVISYVSGKLTHKKMAVLRLLINYENASYPENC